MCIADNAFVLVIVESSDSATKSLLVMSNQRMLYMMFATYLDRFSKLWLIKNKKNVT